MNKLNKKTLIIIAIVLVLLLCFGLWQLALIILGVLALIYALGLIRQDYALDGDDKEVGLEFLEDDSNDKEIKDHSDESKKDMNKKNKNKNKMKNNNNSNNKHRELISKEDVKEVKAVIKNFKLTTYEKAVIVVFSIFAVIMIAFIVILANRQVNTEYEVETKDELVMTEEEREANKKKREEEKKAKEEAEKKELEEKEKKEQEEKEAKEKEEAEKKAQEEKTKKENIEFIDESISPEVKPQPVNDPSPVSSDVYQN